MRLKIAMFAPPGDELSDRSTIYAEALGKFSGFIRRTEYVEVQFPELPREETVERELEVLDAMETKIRLEAQGKIAQVQDQRKKLLALTDQRVTAEA